ncbi:LysR family transcriptional regulator [Devosia sp. RR2S18]|uniref:LysR family transcriptional regulator n=1 Tax=Devosia rhizosphaerae TaxID=3049774 RepID=UPI00253FDE8E|nr:LysR family transcriptional regulator [Devosia sp. RR2S18]WIJ26458.1 LysR family transcriptional regulator [Devosia sp. RR2S18]
MAIANPFAGVEVFVAAIRAGSFTAAAAHLGVTKSAVAKAVTQLEGRLGVKLLHRTTRRLSLTPEGAAFFEQAEASLDQLRAAEDAARSRASTVRGVLRVDMPAAFGRRVAMPVLLDILKAHPGLRLAASFSDRIIDPVEEGMDLCLRFGELPDRIDIVARRLGSQRLVICASPGYLAAAGIPSDLDDLQHHSCILGSRPERPVSWRIVDDQGRARSIDPPATHLVSDGEAVIAMTLAGFGLCQMPQSLVRAHIDGGELTVVLPDRCLVESPISALWPATRIMLPRVRVVVDELVRRAEAGRL